MGYKFTMCPCNNQPNVKEKHFKPLLSTALAKWAWVQLSPVPWPLVPCIPTAVAAFCTPTLPRQLSPSPGTAPVECRCSSHDPTSAWHALLVLFSSCGHQNERGPKEKGRKNRNKAKIDFPWSISVPILKYILLSSLWELVYLMSPQHFG